MKRKPRKSRKHARDVASATASMAVNLLPLWAELDPSEQFRRLRSVIEGALFAFEDIDEEFRVPEPSRN